MRKAHVTLLDPFEAAALLHMPVRALADLWRDGRGPRRTRIDGKVFVTKAELFNFIEACSESPDRRIERLAEPQRIYQHRELAEPEPVPPPTAYRSQFGRRAAIAAPR